MGAPLTDLTPGTLYHYRIIASSSRGTVIGKDNEFSTSGGKPQVETLAVRQVAYIEAILAGTVEPKDVATTFHFEYGPTEAYGSSTPEHIAETKEEVRSTIHDLTPGMTYHFRIVATNSYGTTYGADRTFLTGIEPLVQTDAPANVGSTGAALTGTVNHMAPKWPITSNTASRLNTARAQPRQVWGPATVI